MSNRNDVYGIGNALVDIQYEVDPAFLKKAGIDKGVMTLVDEKRQQEIIDGIEHPPLKQSSGGSAANSMIAMARLGGKAIYACKVGSDPLADFYLQDLEAAGVAVAGDNRADGTTGRCLVLITPDAERTMNTFLGITGSFGPEQLDEGRIAESAYLYIEGYLLSSDSGFAAAQAAQKHAHKHNTRVALTLSDPFIVGAFRERVADLLSAGVELLFCNDVEARAWTGKEEIDAACEALAGEVKRFAVTCGSEGARVRDGGRTIALPGFRVEAIDTNGAGDAFAGAYLYGMTHGHDAPTSGRIANYAASRVVSKFGPRLDASITDGLKRVLEI